MRSAGAVQVIQGAADPSNLNNKWRLIIVERIKATEALFIYSLTPGTNRQIVTGQTLTGIGRSSRRPRLPLEPACPDSRKPALAGRRGSQRLQDERSADRG